jgi:hypothetical protein
LNSSSRYIHQFLIDRPGYLNRQQIVFIVNEDDSMILSHVIKNLLQENNIQIGLSYTSNNFEDFIRDFELAGMRELHALSPEHLWAMYYKGMVEVYCIFEVKTYYFSLHFTRQGNKLIACNDDDTEYELDELLQTPTQFAAYTYQQAMLHKP